MDATLVTVLYLYLQALATSEWVMLRRSHGSCL